MMSVVLTPELQYRLMQNVREFLNHSLEDFPEEREVRGTVYASVQVTFQVSVPFEFDDIPVAPQVEVEYIPAPEGVVAIDHTAIGTVRIVEDDWAVSFNSKVRESVEERVSAQVARLTATELVNIADDYDFDDVDVVDIEFE
jgi:hypothetical protein